ncbi:MAG: phosphatidylserine decarboxylase, partial [Oscillospiraceae bacterium]|nr:phosphatidylserine decarboxylase [Oscillospiraceae bacterium]
LKKHIRMSDYAEEKFRSFNAFFTRPVKPSARPIDTAPEVLISPCDAKLTVVPVSDAMHFTVKGADYSLAAFLGCKRLAERFRGGQVLIFRLTPDDYHRYCYPDACEIGKTRCIAGQLHTVNPVSAEHDVKVYHRNTRTVTMLHTAHFGTMLMIEVGAMFVGKIVNHPHGAKVARGIEKGYFEFGGSTIVIVLEKDAAVIDAQILANSRSGAETIVRYGSGIGKAK